MKHANAGRTLVATGSASGQLLVFTNSYNRGVAQLVARLLWEQNAAGSSPVTPTMASVLTAFEMLWNTRFLYIAIWQGA